MERLPRTSEAAIAAREGGNFILMILEWDAKQAHKGVMVRASTNVWAYSVSVVIKLLVLNTYIFTF